MHLPLSPCLRWLSFSALWLASTAPTMRGADAPAPAPVAASAPAAPAATDPASLTVWPPEAEPGRVGYRVGAYLFPDQYVTRASVHYAQDSMWVHALKLSNLLKDEQMKRDLIAHYDPVLAPGGEALLSPTRHVDHSIMGIVPLELYIQTKDPRYLAVGKQLADRQWENPTPEGLSGETRFWIDDMYMITILQVQAWRATGDPKYLDRAALEMVAYLDKLQRDNGLFYHGPEFPFFWGRGNGWVAAGMAELLGELPPNHPQRARIMDGYQKMMSALLKYQDADGSWHQLLDHPESYKEASCTAMFTYAFITGVQRGWLKAADYAPAARRGWLATTKFVNEEGAVTEVCIGTGQQNNVTFYLTRPRRVGDPHGHAPVLWCAVALLKGAPSAAPASAAPAAAPAKPPAS